MLKFDGKTYEGYEEYYNDKKEILKIYYEQIPTIDCVFEDEKTKW